MMYIQVAVINFSKSYANYENPVCVSVNNSSLVVGMTTPHDIIMTDHVIETQVVSIILSFLRKVFLYHKNERVVNNLPKSLQPPFWLIQPFYRLITGFTH